MTCSKMACYAVASQATAGVSLYFRYFPANTNNSLVYLLHGKFQITNLFLKRQSSYLFLVLIPYCTQGRMTN